MIMCPKCGKPIIKSSFYDPDGTYPLYGGIIEQDSVGTMLEWWICNNTACEDGVKNTAGNLRL